MSANKSMSAVVAGVLVIAAAAFATVPGTINYQGYLKDTVGTPVSTTTTIRFSLYSSNPTRNNPVWTETKSVSPSNGIYSTQLGSATPITTPFDVPYWLGIKVAGDDEMALQSLSSVPYAKRAATADSVSSSNQIISTVATGTAPLSVVSTTVVPNLNADMLDGRHSSDLVLKSGDTMTGDLTISGASINLPATTASAGMIRQGGNRVLHTFGSQNFFAGTNAGNLTTSGYSNTAVGATALTAVSSGFANTATGNNALRLNSTGNWSTASGTNALYANTSGTENTADGGSALGSNTTGSYNTASGAGALNNNTIGSENTANGRYALMNNSTANKNTAIGVSALYSQSYSNAGVGYDSFNTAAGYQAMYSNQPTATSNGNYNAALGSFALSANTTGYNNAAFGADSLKKNTTGISNTAAGYSALFWNTTGSGNTAIGRDAGIGVGTGSNNTLVGFGANVGANNLSNATAIGYNALVSQSDSLVLGSAGVKVGIGTTTPSEVLDVVGNIRLNSKDLYLQVNTDTNHGLGWYGGGKLFAGASLDGPALYGFSGGALGITNGGQKIALAWNNSGNVGIGTTSPDERLDVAGTVKATAFSGSGAALTGLNAGSITAGTLAIAQGGTGAANAATALVTLGAASVTHNHDATYQKKYFKIAVVAETGGDYTNPRMAMARAEEWCGLPSVGNPCLLKLVPGIYDIGGYSIEMQPYVDIEGSGEGVTRIRGTIDSDVAGVVTGASNAELRNLTVENTGAGNFSSIAIYNGNASTKISHVTATATTTVGNAAAVWNNLASPTLQDVTLLPLSSPNNCYGIYNQDSALTITNASITTGSTCWGEYGIYNHSHSFGSLLAANLHIVISKSGGNSSGIYDDGGNPPSTVVIRDSLITNITDPVDSTAIKTLNTTSRRIRIIDSKLEGRVSDRASWPVIYEGVYDYQGNYRISGSPVVQAGTETSTALVVRGHDRRNANLQEWWDAEGGIIMASMSKDGVLSLPISGLSIGTGGSQFIATNNNRIGIGGVAFPAESLDVAGNIKMSGTVIPGTPIPAASLDLSGKVSKSGDTMTGVLNLPANGLAVGTSQFVVSGGNIGIGTASPNEQLEITGNLRLPATTSASGVIKKGINTLLHTYGTSNIFAGENAGNLAMSGYQNTALGANALHATTSGHDNTAIGFDALEKNQIGSGNTAVGYTALNSVIGSVNNTAAGYQSQRFTTSQDNTSIGALSLWRNTGGSANTASGTSALSFNTTASYNTALGAFALYNQSYDNSATTWYSNNTALGFMALYANQPTRTTNGINNTAVGYQAGYTATPENANISGYNNTFIGANSGPGTTTQLGNATALGYNAQVSQNNSLVLGGTGPDAVNVGIGTKAPAATLTVVNSAAATRGLTVQGAASQSANLQEWQNSAGAILSSVSSIGVFTGTGSGLTGLNAANISSGVLPITRGGTGSSTQNFVDLSTSQTVGGSKTFSSSITASGGARISDQQIFLRGGSDALHGIGWYVSNGFVSGSKDGPVVYGCGGGTLGSTCGGNRAALTWDNASNVNLSGTLDVASIPTGTTSNYLCSSGANSGTLQRCGSSRRLKEKIVDLPFGLDAIRQLRPVSFTWKANGNEDIGFIAEEVAELNPVLAIYNEQGEPDGVKYANMSAVLVKAMQEQQVIIEQLKSELAELKKLINH